MRPLACFLLVFALAACAGDDAAAPVEITALVVYTPAAEAATPDLHARIAEAFDQNNAIYREGRLGFRIVPVHMARVAYTEADRLVNLQRLLDPHDGPLDTVHVLRDAHEADLVVMVVDQADGTINASILATPETAFALVHWDLLGAPRYGLAHEIGHLQGARHEPARDSALAPFPYGHAFHNDTLRTLLANSGQRKVPRFSGPDQRYEGAVLGDAARSDNARVLRETAVYLANFRGPQTPTRFVPPGTWPTLPPAAVRSYSAVSEPCVR